LEPIANQALRICLGAFKTSPTASLQVEAYEPPLHLRRDKLSLQYAVKIAANPSNPAFETVFPDPQPSRTAPTRQRRNTIQPFGLRIAANFSTIIAQNHVMETKLLPFPPWLRRSPLIITDLHSGSSKAQASPHTLLAKFYELRAKYQDHEAVYTDGSKTGETTAAAAIILSHSLLLRLPDGSSVFSAELHAIQLALSHIRLYPNNKYIIFTDSLSSLQSIQSSSPNNPLATNIQSDLHTLLVQTTITLCWVPSHIGIPGNEQADKAAKKALTLPASNIPIISSDLHHRIKQLISDQWQQLWNQTGKNKLRNVLPTISLRPKPTLRMKRREQSVMSRLRIGHSHITHSYLLKKEDPPKCIPCQQPLTIEHILIHCIDFNDSRIQFFNCNNINDLFNTVSPSNIIGFLKDIRLFHKI